MYPGVHLLSVVTVNRDTLTCMAVAMRENVGLVHQMPFVCDREGFAAVLEKVSVRHMMQSLIGDKICALKSTAIPQF